MMVAMLALLPSLAGCNDGPVGMSLLFQTAGREVLVQKFDCNLGSTIGFVDDARQLEA